MGFGSCRSTKVLLLNAHHRFARLSWAREYRGWSVDDLKQVAWSDDSDYLTPTGDHLHPFMLFCYLHGNGVLQQDNCTSHKSRLATGWLDEHSFDFSVINWLPRSPELNLMSIFGMFSNKA
ncbi:uncharacterized protein TNCV_904291 [Trichonephila clavipes]|nr:uncharacterized protein TNCV_904291 [Trichonephila clavipes]